MNISTFTQLLHQQGEELYRSMPWRDDTRPYYVLVSELMLQQTQVSRVIIKFEEFIAKFPDEQILANADLADVLTVWQGLGYNRRAKFLHEAAKQIVHLGKFPSDYSGLVALPGVGKNTAGAILAYSFNQPSVYIETNVRTVYIHHFFADESNVDDAEIIKLLELTIDKSNPRRFYQNIMDYGSWLKANGVRNISSSKHYKKQTALEGSIRQVRGWIIRELTAESVGIRGILIPTSPEAKFQQAMDGLISDGLIESREGRLYLTK